MRKFMLALLSFTLSAVAQAPAPAADSGWQRVQALPVDATIYISGHPHAHCSFVSADADSLTCKKSSKVLTFQRATITTIKRSHRGRSTLIGLGVGLGVGSGIGFAAGTSNSDGFFGPNFLRGAITVLSGALGGIVGTVIGVSTDFSRATVYRSNSPVPAH